MTPGKKKVVTDQLNQSAQDIIALAESPFDAAPIALLIMPLQETLSAYVRHTPADQIDPDVIDGTLSNLAHLACMQEALHRHEHFKSMLKSK